MKVHVDMDLCELHGQCEYVAAELFRVTDDGDLDYEESPPEEAREKAELAAQVCPTLAIRLAQE